MCICIVCFWAACGKTLAFCMVLPRRVTSQKNTVTNHSPPHFRRTSLPKLGYGYAMLCLSGFKHIHAHSPQQSSNPGFSNTAFAPENVAIRIYSPNGCSVTQMTTVQTAKRSSSTIVAANLELLVSCKELLAASGQVMEFTWTCSKVRTNPKYFPQCHL